jgi:hypothetical protein
MREECGIYGKLAVFDASPNRFRKFCADQKRRTPAASMIPPTEPENQAENARFVAHRNHREILSQAPLALDQLLCC